MTEKRFIIDDDGIVTDMVDLSMYIDNDDCCEKLNELNDENRQLKQALLFFVDVTNSECSSNWQKDMENDCQKLFNCSYEEAKEKYGDYDCTWWELGE